jgi:hypothetical protein
VQRAFVASWFDLGRTCVGPAPCAPDVRSTGIAMHQVRLPRPFAVLRDMWRYFSAPVARSLVNTSRPGVPLTARKLPLSLHRRTWQQLILPNIFA